MKHLRLPLLLISTILLLFSCMGRGGNTPDGSVKTVDTIIVNKVSAEAGATVLDTINLGILTAGDVVEREVRLVNNDTVPMVIMRAATPCNCVTAEYEKTPAKPGGTAIINLRYDSKGQSGSQFKSVNIMVSGRYEPHTIHIVCEVR